MKLRVKVEGREFNVEVGDLGGRPIVATVDGVAFEVWPEVGGAEQSTERAQERGEVQRPGRARVAVGRGAGAAVAKSPEPAPAARPATPVSEPRPTRRAAGEGVGGVLGLAGFAARAVLAPIPGLVDRVSVEAGDRVVVGQELFVIEAMKMKNVIRAGREGVVGSVRVAVGQHVRQRDPLLEYAE